MSTTFQRDSCVKMLLKDDILIFLEVVWYTKRHIPNLAKVSLSARKVVEFLMK